MIKDNLVFAFEKGDLRIFIIGEIDNRNVVAMREKIDGKIRESSPERVVLNLSRLDTMDSSGIGFIIGRHRLLQEIQAELVIENPNTYIFQLLKCAGLDRITKTANPR